MTSRTRHSLTCLAPTGTVRGGTITVIAIRLPYSVAGVGNRLRQLKRFMARAFCLGWNKTQFKTVSKQFQKCFLKLFCFGFISLRTALGVSKIRVLTGAMVELITDGIHRCSCDGCRSRSQFIVGQHQVNCTIVSYRTRNCPLLMRIATRLNSAPWLATAVTSAESYMRYL